MEIDIGSRIGQWEVVGIPAPSPKTGRLRGCDRATCICRGCNGTYEVLITNLRRGRTGGCSKCASRKGETIIIDNQALAATEWSQYTGVDHRTIRTRLRLGWSPKDAVTVPALSGRPCKKIVINGVSKTKTEWLRHTGLSKETLRQRLAKGWSLEDALSTPRQKPGPSKKPLDNAVQK